MRCFAYGVLGRICFPCMRVTPESARHSTSRFLAAEVSFRSLSSAFSSGFQEMPSCQVSSQETPSAESCPCYKKAARTRFSHSPSAFLAATAFSGDGEFGNRVLTVEAPLMAPQPRNRTVLRLFLVDACSVFGASCFFRCAQWISIGGLAFWPVSV